MDNSRSIKGSLYRSTKQRLMVQYSQKAQSTGQSQAHGTEQQALKNKTN